MSSGSSTTRRRSTPRSGTRCSTRRPAPRPFMRHEYLLALHASGSASAATGWRPQFLVGAARRTALRRRLPAVPEGRIPTASTCSTGPGPTPTSATAWRYYPKLLMRGAVHAGAGPASAGARRRRRAACCCARCSSSHAQARPVVGAPAVPRRGRPARPRARPAGCCAAPCSSTGRNRDAAPYADFADFLASLQRDKRKKIQQERRRVVEAGVSFGTLAGQRRSAQRDWDFFYRCYTLTYRAHHSTPYLTRDFFARMASTMPEHWLLFVARRGDERIAASLIAHRPDAWRRLRPLLGRAPSTCPACTSRPATTSRCSGASPSGYQRFEGGAQGEHKMARGLLPVQTLVGALARAPAVRAGGGRLPGARRRRRRGLHRRAERAAPVQGRLNVAGCKHARRTKFSGFRYLRNAALTCAERQLGRAAASTCAEQREACGPGTGCSPARAATPPSCARDRRRKLNRPRWPSASSCALKPSLSARATSSRNAASTLARFCGAKIALALQIELGSMLLHATPAAARRRTGLRSRGCASTGANCRRRRAGSWPSSAPGSRHRASDSGTRQAHQHRGVLLVGRGQQQALGRAPATSGCGTRVYGARAAPVAEGRLQRAAHRRHVHVARPRRTRPAPRRRSGAWKARSLLERQRVHVLDHLVEAARMAHVAARVRVAQARRARCRPATPGSLRCCSMPVSVWRLQFVERLGRERRLAQQFADQRDRRRPGARGASQMRHVTLPPAPPPNASLGLQRVEPVLHLLARQRARVPLSSSAATASATSPWPPGCLRRRSAASASACTARRACPWAARAAFMPPTVKRCVRASMLAGVASKASTFAGRRVAA